MASLKPLYVFRPLQNGHELTKWAAAQGLSSTLKPSDMHVTIAYSKTPVDWSKWSPAKSSLIVRPHHRQVAVLGDKGAVVLKFQSANLERRWQQFKDGGASWDYEGYKPHITVTYDLGNRDIGSLRPFTGDLIFGPEVFEPIDDEAVDKLVERSTP